MMVKNEPARFIHGVSSRSLGDMRVSEHRKHFLASLGLSDYSLLIPEQVHGNTITEITCVRLANLLGSDGIVLLPTAGDQDNKRVAIGILIADCTPLLFWDPVTGIIGVAHAGWRGTLAKIGSRMVDVMRRHGSKPKDIHVIIGPHIGGCCYTVSKERVDAFWSAFGRDQKIAYDTLDSWHLDIGYANYIQLIQAGVDRTHIDARVSCTSCQIAEFYSYRRDTKETFGEMIGVIAAHYETKNA